MRTTIRIRKPFIHGLATLLFLLLIGGPTLLQAQKPTIGLNYWKCNGSELGNIVQSIDSLFLPIAQELVDEGKILGFGTMTHQTGDEWNLVYYITATDAVAFMQGFQESVQRFTQRHPDAAPLTDHCREHKDNIYTFQHFTQPPFSVKPGEPITMGLSHWKCDFAKVGELVQLSDSLGGPIDQMMVDEGKLITSGMATHQWGDEWNVVWYSGASDIQTYHTSVAELNQRINEKHPDAFDQIMDACWTHKDNIYTVHHTTVPAPQ